MPTPTVAQRFGLKPEELTAATILTGLEGYRGPNSTDPAAVMASVLQRRLSGQWGGRDIRNIATAPGQFASILDRKINMGQLGDPTFGARLLGGQNEFNRIQAMINDPSIVAQHMGKVGESFRALSAGPRPGDYIPVPGKSNFYFGQNPAIVKRGLGILSAPSSPQPPAVQQPGVLEVISSALGFNPIDQQEQQKSLAQTFLDKTKQQLIQEALRPSLFNILGSTTGGL